MSVVAPLVGGDVIAFWVPGVARGAGSKTPIPYVATDGRTRVAMRDGRTAHAAARAKDWRTLVAYTGARAYRGPLLTEALTLAAVFVRSRPAAHFRESGTVKPTAPARPNVRPDLTKLLRAAEDALTGVLWADDAQICDSFVRQYYGDRPGAAIAVTVAGSWMGLIARAMHEARWWGGIQEAP